MNYQEAHDYIYNEIGDEGENLLKIIAEDKTIEGLSLIKKITSCDDNTAKKLWIDVKCDYGTSENNPFVKEREISKNANRKMNYEEAHNYIYYKIGDKGLELLKLIADDNTIKGLSFIKELTLCDDDTAKMLWTDLKCDYGTSETNSIIKARERAQKLTPQEIAYNNAIAREWQNKPKCPTCSSTNIKKIGTTSKLAGAVTLGLFSKTARSQFQCKNCGYKW